MRLYSARPDTVTASLFRTRPLYLGTEEYLYPARAVPVPPGFSDWPDADVPNILEVYGMSGIIKAPPGESDDVVMLRAKQIRHKFLHRQLMNYRLAVSAQQAAGTLTTLPGPTLTELAGEFRGLDTWMRANDPVLAVIGALPTETPRETVERVIGEEIRSIGTVAAPATSPATDIPL